jgi:hypothetical protein
MSFVGGKLRLKSKDPTTQTTTATKPTFGASFLDKRKREATPDPVVKVDKKGNPKEIKPLKEEEVKKEEKLIHLDLKTDYEKRIALHKEQRLKDKVEKKLKTTHR